MYIHLVLFGTVLYVNLQVILELKLKNNNNKFEDLCRITLQYHGTVINGSC